MEVSRALLNRGRPSARLAEVDLSTGMFVFPFAEWLPETQPMSDELETKADPKTFDFDAYAKDTLFYDRRTERDRRGSGSTAGGEPFVDRKKPAVAEGERRVKKERRKRIDPTTFEKQYTDDEMEFMNEMQRFKDRTCKRFPTHAEVLDVVFTLGYRKPLLDDETEADSEESQEFQFVATSS